MHTTDGDPGGRGRPPAARARQAVAIEIVGCWTRRVEPTISPVPSSQTGVPKISAAQPIGPISRTTAIRIENARPQSGSTPVRRATTAAPAKNEDQRQFRRHEERVGDVVERAGGRRADAVVVDRRGEVTGVHQHAEDGRRSSAGERERARGVLPAFGLGEPRAQDGGEHEQRQAADHPQPAAR